METLCSATDVSSSPQLVGCFIARLPRATSCNRHSTLTRHTTQTDTVDTADWAFPSFSAPRDEKDNRQPVFWFAASIMSYMGARCYCIG